jgi:eukaryotic-like serine/threonine-protein kinase
MSSSSHQPGESVPPFSLPDRYRVKRHLANGGMASVWCAEDNQLDRSVAIKVLAQRFAHDAEAVRRFRREARAAARVGTHPHVVTVYDVDVTPPDGDGPGRAFIVMEYLAGGTVADAIRHDDIRRQEAIRWLREAGSALDHAHAAGIVHRDIKPANFLLDRSRVLHVADFGIARLTTEETITSPDQLFGTAAYLSPEQALGREATSASDRYALAVVAFELLVGERPFHSPHFSAQARQHIEEPPPSASERNRTIPPAVDSVLAAGLAKDPLQRPRSADEFVRALESALGEHRPLHRHAPARRPPGPAIGAPDALTAAARGGRGRSARRSVAADADRRGREAPTWTPTSPPPPTGRRKRRRLAALAALLGVVAIVAVAAAAATGAFKGSSGDKQAASASVHKSHRAGHRQGNHAGGAATTQAAANSAPSAAALEATGHRQMLDHNYTEALQTLKQAVSTADPSSNTYAYALYDLGRTMLLSGDAKGAIPVLQKRLSIPIQTATVQHTLDRALEEAGLAQPTTPAPSTTPAPTTSTTTTQSPTTTTPTTPTQPSGGAGIAAPPAHGGPKQPGTGTAPGKGAAPGNGPDKDNGAGPGKGNGPDKGNGPGKGNGPDGHDHGNKPGKGNGPGGGAAPGKGSGDGPSGGSGLDGLIAELAGSARPS